MSDRHAFLRTARDSLAAGRLHDALMDVGRARDLDRAALDKAQQAVAVAVRNNDESERLASDIWRALCAPKLRPDGSPECGR